jgi:thiosulfate dehydrogenase (quinone) large subunit
MNIIRTIKTKVTTQIKEGKMNTFSSISPKVVTQIPESPITRFLFADTRMAWFWLIVRLYLALSWLGAAVGKLTGYDVANGKMYAPWVFGAHDGEAITAFAKYVIAHGGASPFSAFPEWFVGAPDWYASFLQTTVLPHAALFSYLVTFGELLVSLGLIFGALTSFAAFFALFMNLNFVLTGVVSVSPAMGILALFIVLAWRVAGYYGVDRWLLPLVGTPWTGSLTQQKRSEALKPSPIVPCGS